MKKVIISTALVLLSTACGTSTPKDSNSLSVKAPIKEQAVDCAPDLLSGEYTVSQDVKHSSVDFPSSERDLNESKENKPLFYVAILRSASAKIEQSDCSQIKVTTPDYLAKEGSESKDVVISLSPAKNEKISWTNKSLTLKGESGFPAILGFLGRRTYTVKLEKLENGNIMVSEKVTGQALIPVPLPATWKESYELVLKK
jgi:hypothetical protein